MADQQECVRCGRGAAWTESVCIGCGTTLLFDVTLLSAPTEPRVRYELTRELTALKRSLNTELAAQFKRPRPMLAHRVTRDDAAAVGRVLAGHSLEFELSPLALGPSVGAGKSSIPKWPGVVMAVLALGSIAAIVARRPAQLPSSAQVSTDDSSERPRARPLNPTAAPSMSEAMKSVVSVRCKNTLGSGFFVAPGKVLTNHHVLCPEGGAPRVVTSDGVEVASQIAGRDEQHDLAVLDVELDVAPLPLGDAAAAELGASVSIMGSPKGLEFSVQRGSIAFVGRVMRGVGYLQLDSAVNPGNSGGPVIDTNGRVIAVVTARVNNADGIGFAVPINYALTGVLPSGPQELLTEEWRAFEARVAQAPNSGAPSPASKSEAPADFKYLLVRAKWFAPTYGRDEQPSIDTVVVTADPDATQRRWRFTLMKQDSQQCDLFNVKTLAWVRLESTDPNLDPALARRLVDNQVDRKLFVGVMRLQWSSCPGIYMNQARELALELPGAPPGYDRVGIAMY